MVTIVHCYYVPIWFTVLLKILFIVIVHEFPTLTDMKCINSVVAYMNVFNILSHCYSY